MGRESHDPVVLHSSIALLQERFRQLQKVKEMREERELSRMVLHPTKYISIPINRVQHDDDPTSRLFFFHPELILHHPLVSPHQQMSFSLWPNLQNKLQVGDHHSQYCEEAPGLISFWPTDQSCSSRSSPLHALFNEFEDSVSDDIDTSLHL
ncbi:hypothetical protein Tsubulata_020648 [Turnera subulata]|uniref:Uncharacterized protein n=1 Tax=Turnera subulata TaxID=218843 RepID=A0A9Q0GEN8_9ROSI|nr:hypothetical protein Tsubulata_020648 [Turnera subulata]